MWSWSDPSRVLEVPESDDAPLWRWSVPVCSLCPTLGGDQLTRAVAGLLAFCGLRGSGPRPPVTECPQSSWPLQLIWFPLYADTRAKPWENDVAPYGAVPWKWPWDDIKTPFNLCSPPIRAVPLTINDDSSSQLRSPSPAQRSVKPNSTSFITIFTQSLVHIRE